MNDMQKVELLEEQNALMKLYEEAESEPDEYKNFQVLLDILDGWMERIRCYLEGRWTGG